MELRKLCNHPFLCRGMRDTLVGGSTREEEIESLVTHSGKFVLVDKLLPKLRAGGHKVLIFSQMVKMLNILQEYTEVRGYPTERLDGGISANARQAARLPPLCIHIKQ